MTQKFSLSALTSIDFFIFLLTTLTVLFFILWECKDKGVSETLRQACQNHKNVYGLVLGMGLLFVAPYFSPGFPTRGDSLIHVFPSWYVSENFLAGRFSLWTNFSLGGLPYARLYGPLFYFLTACVTIFTHDYIFSIKTVLALCYVFSGLFLFCLFERLKLSKKAALIGVAAYLLCYFRFYWILEMGRLRYEIFLLIFPLLWLWGEDFIATRKKKYIFYQALGYAALVLGQPGPYAIHTMIFFMIYALCRVVFLPEKTAGKVSIAAFFTSAILLGICVTLPVLAPNISAASSALNLLVRNNMNAPAPSFISLIQWGIHSYSYGAYLGLSVLILALAGAFSGWFHRDARANSFTICCALSFFLALGRHLPGYNLFPFVYAHPSSGYFLLFSVFFLSIMAALGAQAVLDYGQKRIPRIFFFLLLCLLVDLVPLNVRDYFQDRPFSKMEAIYQWFNARTDKTGKVFEQSSPGDYQVSAVMFSLRTGFVTLNGAIPGYGFGLPNASRNILAMTHRMNEHDFSFDKARSEALRSWFYLSGTKYFLAADSFFPREIFDSQIVFENAWIGEFHQSSPLIASSKLHFITKDFQTTQDVFEPDCAVDINNKRCDAIKVLVKNGKESELVASDTPPVLTLKKTVLDQSFFTTEFHVDQSSFLHVSQAFYPGRKVLLDGKEVDEIFETFSGWMAIKVPAGEHSIIVTPAFRKTSDHIWAGIGLLALIMAWKFLYLGKK